MFDVRFTRFITNTWISIIWVIVITIHCLVVPIAVIAAFVQEPMAGVIAFFAVPLVGLLTLLLFRMSLEMTIVLFRIETHLRAMREKDAEQKS